MNADDVRWLASYEDEGRTRFRIGRAGDELVAEWVGLAELRVRRDGRDPRFTHAPDAYAPDIAKIEKGSVRLLLRHLEGRLSFHGAAVSAAGASVVLLGRGGQGKSTLAARLCQRGTELLSDDAVAIEHVEGRYEVEPFETNHWLEPASLRALGVVPEGEWKAAVPADHPATRRAPLRAFCDLTYDDTSDAPRLERVQPGLVSVQALVLQTVRFVLDESDLAVRELDALLTLLGRVPLFRLVRPHGLEHLDAAAGLVLDLLEREE